MKERIGKFYISIDSIVNQKEGLAKTLSIMDFIPVRVEFIYHKKEFEYIGFSVLFEELEEGSEAPEYIIVTETKHNEVVNVRAIKK